MTVAAPNAPAVTPAALAAVLGDDHVLIAARRLIGARLRRQEALRMPNGPGQPEMDRRSAMFHADTDAGKAREDLAEAAFRAVDRLVREGAL
jgi:hypothetical protein